MNMKKFNYIYKFIVSIVFIGAMGSCSDLEPVDYSEINPSNFPVTDSDIQALVMSCYYPLRGSWWDGIFTTSERGVMFINDCTTGILTGDYGPQLRASEMNYYPSTEDITWFYYTSNTDEYSGGFANKVSRCTLVLNDIENSALDDATKTKYEAEVRCARAFLSYLLYDMYGPIIVASIDQLKNPLEESPQPRMTREEMVKFIEDDLLFASENLPMPSKTTYGRFSKGLAKMLLIRLYLHETPYDKGYYNKVETLAREMMTSSYGYQLQSDYVKMFAQGGQGSSNKEIIWAIPCSYDGPNQNQWHMMCLPTDFNQGGMTGGWGGVTSTWYFYDSFESADVRKTMLLPQYTNTAGDIVDKETESTPLAKGPIAMKYGYDTGVNGSGGYTNIDITVFRYADVYLSLAEALTMKEGSSDADKSEAINLVNVVRNRAKLGNLLLADYNTQDKLLDAILLERYHEFWCENGQFRADLIRYHKLVPLVKKITQSTYAEEYKELYPLPLSVISDGKGVVKQNPGYN
jgi:hypothetical protein